TSTAPFAICIKNVNRRTSTSEMLSPHNQWVFLLSDTSCVSFAQLQPCSGAFGVSGPNIVTSDLDCNVTADSVVISHSGQPRPFAFEEQICIAVNFIPTGLASCTVDYRFTP